MKYVLTGSAGNITRPLASTLLSAGHQVVVIGRDAARMTELTAQGATAAIGSVEDTAFLTETFRGADAVYTMVPPHHNPTSWKEYIGTIGANYAAAIADAGVKKVVNLSSIGAHVADGCGPVSGLYRVEQALNGLTGVDVLHLRPGFFYLNFLGTIGMVKGMNIMGGNYGDADTKLVLVHPDDIAAVAAEALQSFSFTGHSVRYIASDERTTGDVAGVIGDAVGKPGLPWVEFTDEQNSAGMKQAGMPDEIVTNYTEMGAAMRSGIMQEDYWKHRPAQLGATKLEDFARSFAAIYAAS
ncbi:MAG: NAD-dependent dehydratase [Flaviaesturariibacter sp.]|nr:NAD-dependent dehydratase [Flaviaesturariibacter sp.]